MSDDYTLLTPENVDLRFDVAGLGSRAAAALIDYMILGVAYVVLMFGVSVVFAFVGRSLGVQSVTGRGTSFLQILGFIVLALFFLVTFLGWWGYFILFEMLWNGQSIGKRRLGLRVVRAVGQPINLTASLVRNILRIVDSILFIGVLVMVVDSRSRRLGDFAAGTLVIREPKESLAKDFAAALRPVEIPTVSPSAVDSFPNPERLTIGHYTLLRDYFARRPSMTARSAEQLAAHLASRLAVSLDVESAAIGDPVTFLAAATRAYEERKRNVDGA